ncbi:MAG: chromate transporter [Bacteroidia bacterium]
MKSLGYGLSGQIVGCLVGTLAIFLPGTLLIFFVYPIWSQVKQYPIIYRSLDGIISVSIGFIWAAAIFMILPYLTSQAPNFIFELFPFLESQSPSTVNPWIALLVFVITLVYLQVKRLPAFLLVLVTILAGYLLYT